MITDVPNPIDLFKKWFEDAKNCAEIQDATAMTLATTDEFGMPWPRVVLLKGDVDEGFCFYTNLESAKARHLANNPRAGLCFFWMPLYKQVRVQGTVQPVSDDEAEAYFASRPRESQLGAWASKQSRKLDSRDELLQRFDSLKREYEGRDVPRPSFWSGYRLKPTHIEFWLGQEHRLHDRVAYDLQDDGDWSRYRLFP